MDLCPKVNGAKANQGRPDDEKKKDVLKVGEPKISLYTLCFESANANISKASKKY